MRYRLRKRARMLWVVGCAVGVAGSSVWGASVKWAVSADGDWNNTGDWSSWPLPPGLTDMVTIDQPGGLYTVSLSSGAPIIADLTLNENLSLSGTGNLSITDATVVGQTGSGVITESGGVLTTPSLTLGSIAGDLGRYSLSAGTLNATAASSNTFAETVALYGVGSFTQSGGTNLTTSLVVGNGAGSSGTYTLWDGSLAASSTNGIAELIAGVGTGVFRQQGGSNATTSLYLASASGSNGTYFLSAGTLTATNTTAICEAVGLAGRGEIVQSGGVHATSSLYLGYNAHSFGYYTLSAGTLTLTTSAAINEIVGLAGTASFMQSGGVHTVPLLTLAYSTGSIGDYILSGGTLSVTNTLTTAEVIGNGGMATFLQSGGTHNTTSMALGLAMGSTGTYSLSQTGVLNTSNAESIGAAGVGTFTQSGGTHSAISLAIGVSSGSTGAYSISDGDLTSQALVVGYLGGGSFTQTGGTVNIPDTINIGTQPSGQSILSISGGTLTAGYVSVGNLPTAVVHSELDVSGGTVRVDQLVLKDGNANAITLSGGSLKIGTLNIYGDLSRFRWTGGTLSITDAPLTIAPTGPLGASMILTPAMTYLAAHPLTIAANGLLQLTGGKLDLESSALIWSYSANSPADMLRSALYSGRDGGAWDGAGVVSGMAASDLSQSLAIGYAETGTLGVATWAGQTITSPSMVTMLTWYGDANLDGKVNADDFALLDRGYVRQLTGWVNGDFDYNGVIDQNDYLLIDRVYLVQSGFLSPDFIAQRQAEFGEGYVRELIASIPEPSMQMLVLILPLAAARRRGGGR